MSTKLHFIGDVHGEWHRLVDIVDKYQRSDLIFQVGDMGILPKAGYNVPKFMNLAKYVNWIEGNHDSLEYILDNRNNLMNHRLSYLLRGQELVIGDTNTKMAVLGGGDSIDKADRIEGVSWFRNELPSVEESEQFLKNALDADIIMTHEPPDFVVNASCSYISDSPLARNLGNAIKYLGIQPKFWISGHIHRQVDLTFGNTRFLVIPPVHRCPPHAVHECDGCELTVRDDGEITFDGFYY